MVGDVFEIFPEAEYIHLGGDEVMKETCWRPDPHVQDFMAEHGMTETREVFTYFLNKLYDDVKAAYDREVIFWSEAESLDIERSDDQLLQFWTPERDLNEFMSLYPNNPHIFSPEDYFYFDVGQSNRYGE